MSTYKPGKRITSKKYFDTKSKMMCEEPWEWAKKEGALNVGEGDALWRTGLAYITWKDPLMKEGILECYRSFGENYHFKKKWYQASRHTGRLGEDDVSRDQVLMSLAALKVNSDLIELDEIASHLPYRLSRRFFMTPDMWSWVRTLTCQSEKKLKMYTNITCLLGIMEKFVAFNLNKLIAKVCGYERNAISNNDYTSRFHYDKKEEWNKLQLKVSKAYYMGFAFHLACWQIYTLPKSQNTFLRRVLTKMMLRYCEKENYLCRILLGDKTVTWEQVENYQPREGFRWQAYLDGSWPNYNGEKSEEWKKKYLKWNQMDRDCLITMWKKEIGNE
tara:strand:- start:330 stop:1322 length:993 start_codon:yes stop_codon:yes gene_type:complete